MKSPAEVIGEMMLAGLRSKTKEEQKKSMKHLYGKVAQITLPNLTEALVLFFEDVEVGGEKKKWIRYESFPTPRVKCMAKNCTWRGFYKDLPIREEKIKLPEGAETSILGTPTKKIIEVKCPVCGSSKLRFKEWVHPDADVVMYGSHWDIGSLGDLVVGPIGHRLKGLAKTLWLVLRGRVKISPVSKMLLGVTVGRLMM
ncbi:MAG: hypothetical protein ACTSR3_14935 [Candidatus Helarchaeota archaeon]